MQGEKGRNVEMPHALRLCSTAKGSVKVRGKLDKDEVLLSRSVEVTVGPKMDSRINGAHKKTGGRDRRKKRMRRLFERLLIKDLPRWAVAVWLDPGNLLASND
jgi:hypothetical protein